MGQILIRKIDDDVLERLKTLAKDRNMPLEALARTALEEAAKRRTAQEMRDAIERFAELRAMTPVQDIDSVAIIRAMREDDDSDD